MKTHRFRSALITIGTLLLLLLMISIASSQTDSRRNLAHRELSETDILFSLEQRRAGYLFEDAFRPLHRPQDAVPNAASGVSTWNGGAGNWSNGAMWTPIDPPNSSGADVFIDGGNGVASAVTLDGGFTVGRLTIDLGDSLSFNNGTSLTIALGAFSGSGTLVNNGTVTINSGGNFTDLVLAGNTTFSGSGTFTLAGAGNARIRGGSRLTNAAGHTIQGQTSDSGSIGNNDTAITNAGLIDANVSGLALVLDPVALTDGFRNTGILQASNGGILLFTGNGTGAFDNTGGTIQALAGSEVRLVNSAAISGGTLSSTGTGFISILGGNNASLADLTNAAAFTVANGANLTLAGTITNNGTILLNAANSFTGLLGNGATLAGSGTLTLQDAAYIGGGGTFTNASTIQGETSNSGSIGFNNTAIINQGLIDANVSTPGTFLLLDPVAGTGTFSNTAAGTLRASNGGLLRLTGSGTGSFTSAGTILATGAGSEVQLTTSVDVNGTFTTAGGGVVRNLDSATLRDATNAGSFIANNGTNTTLVGTLTNNGTILLNAANSFTGLLGNGATLAGSGTLTLQDAAYIGGTGTFTNASTIQGETSNSGSIGFNNTAIINQGLIDANVSTPGTFLLLDPVAGTDTFNNTATGTLRASGGGLLRLTGSGTGSFTSAGTILATGAGSEVQLTTGVDVNGTFTTALGGVVRNLDSATLRNATNAGAFIANNGATTTLVGTVTNNGTILLNAMTSFTGLLGNGATLAGSGTLTLQDAAYIGGTGTFTNASTIQGETSNSGSIGFNNTAIINQGLINANVSTPGTFLLLDPVAGTGTFSNTATGTLRASGGGLLRLTGSGTGSFSNAGIFEALNGSNLTMDAGAVLTNNVAGVLTGGSYRAIATGGGATVTIQGANLTEIDTGTEVILSGAGSVFQVGTTLIETTLTTNDGALRILANRDYTNTNALVANGIVALGGGAFAAPSLTIGPTGELFGFGTVTPRPTNSGLIRAVGGTLVLTNGIQGGSGTVQIDPTGILDLSGGTMGSSADFLFHNGAAAGSLNLGANDFTVFADYNNANFGVGNAFNPRANVAGTGAINAGGNTAQQINGDVTAGTTAAVGLALPNIHEGDTLTRNFRIANTGSLADSPALRGALQTDASGNITDARLSGSGVTPQNFGALAAGTETADFEVTLTGLTPGALATGQTIGIINNFDNVLDQTIAISGGSVYRYAVASPIAPNPVQLLSIREGGSFLSATLTATNGAIDVAGFTETLDGSIAGVSSNVVASGSFSGLAAGDDTDAFSVRLTDSIPGAHSGTATYSSTSIAVPGSGLSNTTLPTQTVTINGNVYRPAAINSVAPNPVTLASIREGGTFAPLALSITNTAVDVPGFTESLAAAFSGAAANVSASGSIASLAPGATDSSAMTVALTDTATAGAKIGTVNLTGTSIPVAGSGLSNLALGSQNLTVQGSVFRLATPSVQPSTTINFGIVHVGDAAPTQTLSITNTAADDGYSESLNGEIGSTTGGVTTNGGSFTLLAPGAPANTSLSVGINTSSAGDQSGTATLAFESDGTGTSELAAIAIASQTVNVTGQVNEFAQPELFLKTANVTLTMISPTEFTIDFGSVAQNIGDITASFGIRNFLLNLNFQDTLGGSFSLTDADDFSFAGFGAFAGIAPGGEFDPDITFDTSKDFGTYADTLFFNPVSSNASGDSQLAQIQLNIQGQVVPEPSTWVMIIAGAGLLIGLQRRRRIG